MIAADDGLTQLPCNEVPDRCWDCLVVGAGPAGSAAAIGVAEEGHGVLLVDRETFPRDKICGEGLIADAGAALRRLGAWEEVKRAGHPVTGLSIFSPSRIRVDASGDYLTLRRHRLDALLARRAAMAGATFAQGEVRAITLQGDGGVVARVVGMHGTVALRARTAVLATGARLALAESLGMVSPDAARPDAVAVRCRVRSDATVDRLVASFDRSVLPGYAWVFPLGEGEYNLGCGLFRGVRGSRGSNLARTFAAFVREFPAAREVWETGQLTQPLRGAPLRCGFQGAKPRGPGAVLAVGEAIGATFPFTGEGIGKALETGILAAEVLHDALSSGEMERLAAYPERLEQELRPKYLSYEIAERWLSIPWLIDFLARRVHRSRRLARAAKGILQETVDPREIFSVTGILRSLLF